MRRCISVEEKQYDSQNQFVSYSIQKTDGTLSFVLQFVRGEGQEQFVHYSLTDSARPGAGERDFIRRKNIISSEDLVNLLAENGTRFALNIVPKSVGKINNLELIINTLDVKDNIRASGMVRALDFFALPFKEKLGIEINPVEVLLNTSDKVTSKKVEGRPSCAIS